LLHHRNWLGCAGVTLDGGRRHSRLLRDLMTFRRLLSLGLAVALATVAPTMAQQTTPPGTVAGRVTGEARKPYADYTVQLRDTETGQVVRTGAVDAEGRFSFDKLDTARTLLVELYHVKEQEIVCTEGPYPFEAGRTAWFNVVVDCGMAPAAWWIMAASAGTVSAVTLLTVSASK
jgi:hypothetical protein